MKLFYASVTSRLLLSLAVAGVFLLLMIALLGAKP